VGVLLARKNLFHGKIGIRRNQGKWRIGDPLDWLNIYSMRSIDDALSILESSKNRVILAGDWILLHGQVRILHWALNAPSVIRSEDISQSKGLSANAPLVIKRRLKCRDHAAASLEILSNLIALFLRKGGNVGEDQNLEAINVRGIEEVVVHHLERNASFD